jgi:peptidoglycan/LPS O-acetylase OafA/YrhL
MPELDTVRGVAILLVVFFHGFAETGLVGLSGIPRLFVVTTMPGWMGVNLFFVLSGFLITGILLDSRGKQHYYKDFYIRRALRILPIYCLLLIVLLLLPRIGWLDHRRISWQFVGLSFIYLSNVTQLFGVPMQYGPLWSLAVEEHFYLLWPSAVRVFSRNKLAWIAASIFICCPLLRAIAFALKYEYGNGYTWLVADGLAAGALLAIYCRRPGFERKNLQRISALCIGIALLLLTAGLPLGILLSSRFAGGILRPTMLNLGFTGALGFTLLVGTSRWQSLVRRPVLQFFGEISYGLYLIHMLVFDVFDHFAFRYFPILSNTLIAGHFALIVVRFVLAAGAAVTIAYLSRRTLEAKFLSLKDRWTGDRSNSSANRPLAKDKALHAA